MLKLKSKMNKLFDKNITLDREAHIYNLATNPDLEFISATTFIDRFFEKFDSKSIAEKLVTSSPKYMDMTVEEVLQSWKNSGLHGTQVHDELEKYYNKDIAYNQLSDKKAINGVDWLSGYTMTSQYIIYPEIIIYSKELKISGTVDLLLFNKETKEYTVMDWKTSKNIPTKAYGNKRGILSESSNIDDSKFNRYSLQLSLYRYLLEKYYGLKISKYLYILHLEENKCNPIIANYMKNDIINMLDTIER